MKRLRDKVGQDKKRQQRYQMRRRLERKCRVCGEPEFQNKGFCQKHYINSRLVALGTFRGTKRNPWMVRRGRLLMFANSVFLGAQWNTVKPFRDWQHVRDVVTKAYFQDVDPRWLRRRLESYSRWLYRWDRRLRHE
jgi:hypothetical protein